MENNEIGNRESLGDLERLAKQEGVRKIDKYRLLEKIYKQTEGEGVGGKKKNFFQKIAEGIARGK